MTDRPVRRAQRDGVAQRRGRHGRLHPGVDGVADYLARVAVLDHAQVELALGVGVLGDVGKPLLVRGRRGEVMADKALPIDNTRRSSWTGGPGLPALDFFRA